MVPDVADDAGNAGRLFGCSHGVVAWPPRLLRDRLKTETVGKSNESGGPEKGRGQSYTNVEHCKLTAHEHAAKLLACRSHAYMRGT